MTDPQVCAALIFAFLGGIYVPAVWSWWRRRTYRGDSVRVLDVLPLPRPTSAPRFDRPTDPSPRARHQTSTERSA